MVYSSFLISHGSDFESGSGAAKIYERLLVDGKKNKKCTACSRHMNDDELRVFEKYVSRL